MTCTKKFELYEKLKKAFLKDVKEFTGIFSLTFEECIKFINGRSDLSIKEIDQLFLDKYFPKIKKEVLEVLNEVILDPLMPDSSLFDETLSFDEDSCMELAECVEAETEPDEKKNENPEAPKKAFYSYEALNTSISAENIIKRIENAEKWKQIDSHSSGIRILLYGISGGGKTSFANHVGEQLGKKVKKVLASDVLDECVGKTEKNIKAIFEEAARDDAVIIMDEADSLLMSRNSCRYTWEISQVNEFLIQMEAYPGIIFCSTNFRENIDSATDRRFHFKVEFFPLEEESVKMLLKGYFPQFSFSRKEVERLMSYGNIVPGDFGNVFSRIRFSDPEEVCTEMILCEFKDLIESKKENLSSQNRIGFAC